MRVQTGTAQCQPSRAKMRCSRRVRAAAFVSVRLPAEAVKPPSSQTTATETLCGRPSSAFVKR
jgi:hypothetical protein